MGNTTRTQPIDVGVIRADNPDGTAHGQSQARWNRIGRTADSMVTGRPAPGRFLPITQLDFGVTYLTMD